ncbi:EAL domain-containing protein [Photobacterium damselae]|uniref:EAL domain-containing protein n=1 Tax=Photobacterium damselae TaxID=38293 RepID=UPI004068D988
MKNKKIVHVLQGVLAVGGVVFVNHPDIVLACNAAIIASVITSATESSSTKKSPSSNLEKFRSELNDAIKKEMSAPEAKSHIFVGSLELEQPVPLPDISYESEDISLNHIDRYLTGNNKIVSSCRTSGNVFHLFVECDDSHEAMEFFKKLHCQLLLSLPKISSTLTTKIHIGFCDVNWQLEELNAASVFAQTISDADVARLVGKNNCVEVQVYEKGFSDNIKDKLELEYDLSNCIDNKEIKLLYQPKVSTITGEIESLEALSRWYHPKRGLISPAFFIPLAEETGAINDIGAFTIEESIKDLSEIIKATKREISLAINVSIKQFEKNDGIDLKRQLFDACSVHGVPHRLIQLEVTETAAARDINCIIEQLDFFKSNDFGISLDDFGVGYSSLLRLSSMPLTQVKIDRAFIIDRSESGIELLKSIVEISKKMDVEIVAEGVETKEQATTIIGLGCDHIQGFLFSKPTSKENIIKMITDKKTLCR